MDHKDWIEVNGLFNSIIQKLNELEERLNKLDGKTTQNPPSEPIKVVDVGSF